MLHASRYLRRLARTKAALLADLASGGPGAEEALAALPEHLRRLHRDAAHEAVEAEEEGRGGALLAPAAPPAPRPPPMTLVKYGRARMAAEARAGAAGDEWAPPSGPEVPALDLYAAHRCGLFLFFSLSLHGPCVSWAGGGHRNKGGWGVEGGQE